MRSDVPTYSYTCVDRSLLVRPFCRYFVHWFVVWMPPAVPANLLTLGSSACMWVMLAMALAADNAAVLAPAFLILMAGYVIYDHADGMHSRRTGTSSPLGEYLDHFTDVFHGAIAVVVMFLVAGRADSAVCLIVLWAVLMAGAATMAEERERKELYFGLTGPLEAMLLTLVFFASWCWPGAAEWWHAPLVGGRTVFECVMIAGAIGSVMTSAACVLRIKRLPAGLAAYALMSALLCARGLYFDVTWWETALLLTLHGADYTGRVIAGHLLGTKRPWPDFVVPILMLGVSLCGVPSMVWAWGAAAYLASRVVRSTGGMLMVFGHHWRWLNPPAVVVNDAVKN
ncbi:CDP-alcohol phosphatidyltransferase family protein [Rariglobus hedericola]|uniref:CDP-alcohol phosphatidyltransferase family protein n=1 Tax=Rariglobus hedericola TaxID=2597822 RepID=A0A556QQU9_9BACT|nr:CDP-alcohol phosphatidyltransferase family protein [Rariglobus hedericola]TSJ79015.1 hypothetical protein FPL22_06865 [Rariglobus hedericola]